LEQIEVWTTRFVKSDDLAIDDRILWKRAASFDDGWILMIERFVAPGKESHATI
jgi:hypothetical protein